MAEQFISPAPCNGISKNMLGRCSTRVPAPDGGSCSFWASLSGVLIQVTNYKAYNGDPVCDLVQGVVAAYGNKYAAGGDYERSRCGNAGGNSANRWQYPAGGAPTNYTTNVSQPDGAAISTK